MENLAGREETVHFYGEEGVGLENQKLIFSKYFERSLNFQTNYSS